ncbi:hypothetical protein [Lysinibacillus xylanilyticus]|uniref:hypothetical protein n=1 Tax=Lysinibacillus xylanilyticus TaxID=582475 RepID=UPI003CFF7DAA
MSRSRKHGVFAVSGDVVVIPNRKEERKDCASTVLAIEHFKKESNLSEINRQNKQPKIEERKKHLINEIDKKLNLDKKTQTVSESIVEAYNCDNEVMDDEYVGAMEGIRNKIFEYEDKHGDKAMEYMQLDSVIRELTREVSVEIMIAEYKYKLQYEQEQERKRFEKMFSSRQSNKVEHKKSIRSISEN